MKSTPKPPFTFVTTIHGNEPIPALALASLNLPHLIANPRAANKEVRFIDHDLNQAFGASGSGYEFRRARQLLDQIPPQATVIDLHTFSCQSDPFVVIVDPALIPLARTTGLRHIVLMQHNIKKGHSLINHRRGISVEVGRHHLHSSFQATINVVNHLKQAKTHPAKIYQVYDTLKKPGNYINFQPHPVGFIPVLAGEQAYPFPGLKARLTST